MLSESDDLPITDDLFLNIIKAEKSDLFALLATMSPGVRTSLALYCYRRSHLCEVGLAIAATCDEDDLGHLGGGAGIQLFRRSRQSPDHAAIPSHSVSRRRVTLSTGHLREMPALD